MPFSSIALCLEKYSKMNQIFVATLALSTLLVSEFCAKKSIYAIVSEFKGLLQRQTVASSWNYPGKLD
jgi:hypothetical protein